MDGQNKYIYCLFAKMNEERLQRMNALATALKDKVEIIDIRANIEQFVMQHRSQQNIPKIVLDHAIFKMTQEKEGKTANPFEITRKQIERILKPHKDPLGQLEDKKIFEIKEDDNVQLLDLRQREKDIALYYSNTVINPDMKLPVLQTKDANQEIAKHLMEYVTKHSGKGGKHSRIDSLHSISRSAKARLQQKTTLIQSTHSAVHSPFDESKEDNDDAMVGRGMSLPPPPPEDSQSEHST